VTFAELEELIELERSRMHLKLMNMWVDLLYPTGRGVRTVGN
jgi:hypothetical protein